MKNTFYILTIVLLYSCQNTAQENKLLQQAVIEADPIVVPLKGGMARAYFASGCFWCVEAIYESVKGVEDAVNGYAGGYTNNPDYASSNTGNTGHAEVVEVIYDPNTISFSELIDVYFSSQNPTQTNGQGPDHGSQYRSIIFYQNKAQNKIIREKKQVLEKRLGKKIAAKIYPFQRFWIAEDYHQNYEKLHPNQSYIQSVSIPRLQKFQRKHPELLKKSRH